MPDITSRAELYLLIQQGLDDVANGKVRPWEEAMAEIRSLYGNRNSQSIQREDFPAEQGRQQS